MEAPSGIKAMIGRRFASNNVPSQRWLAPQLWLLGLEASMVQKPDRSMVKQKHTSSRGLLPGSTLGKAGLPACRNRYAIEIQDFLAEHPGDLALDIVHQICVRAARADSSMTPQIVDEASRHHSQHRSLSLGSSFSFGFALILSSFPSLVRPRLGYHISCLLFVLPFG